MESLELAWAAGIFDGEGTATVCGGRFRLAVKMCDEESVRRFYKALGVGKVYGPYKNEAATRRDGSPRQLSFMWLAEKIEASQAVEMLKPLIGSVKLDAIASAWDRSSQ